VVFFSKLAKINVLDLDPDSMGSLDLDPDPDCKNDPQKLKKANNFR